MAGKGQRGQLRSPAYLCSGCRVSSWGTPQDTGDFRGKSDMVTVFEKGHSGAVKDGWEEEAPSAVHTVHYDQTSQGRYFTLWFHLEWKLRFLSCIFFPLKIVCCSFFPFILFSVWFIKAIVILLGERCLITPVMRGFLSLTPPLQRM